ncbi:MAG: hypothetical protein H6R26_2477 [Proteobacteria bacterium]|nr:hypothetical protein [Pseudomonadota bacterium]
MERYNLPFTNTPPASGGTSQPIPTVVSRSHIGGTKGPYDSPFRVLRTSLGEHAESEMLSPDGDSRPERLSRLSLREFCDRIALLAELELPCAVWIASASAEQVSRGVVRRIERGADRLNLFGDGFSLHLRQSNIDAIWLVNSSGADDAGMAIEIHNRAGNLIARLFGIEDTVGAAVWQDVMGNPSFAVA